MRVLSPYPAAASNKVHGARQSLLISLYISSNPGKGLKWISKNPQLASKISWVSLRLNEVLCWDTIITIDSRQNVGHNLGFVYFSPTVPSPLESVSQVISNADLSDQLRICLVYVMIDLQVHYMRTGRYFLQFGLEGCWEIDWNVRLHWQQFGAFFLLQSDWSGANAYFVVREASIWKMWYLSITWENVKWGTVPDQSSCSVPDPALVRSRSWCSSSVTLQYAQKYLAGRHGRDGFNHFPRFRACLMHFLLQLTRHHLLKSSAIHSRLGLLEWEMPAKPS